MSIIRIAYQFPLPPLMMPIHQHTTITVLPPRAMGAVRVGQRMVAEAQRHQFHPTQALLLPLILTSTNFTSIPRIIALSRYPTKALLLR